MIHVVISKGVDILAHLQIKRIDDDGNGRSDPDAELGTYSIEAGVRHANGDQGIAPWVVAAFPRKQFNALGLLAATMRDIPDRVLGMEEWLKPTTGGDQPGTPHPRTLRGLLSKLSEQINRGVTAEDAREEIQSWGMTDEEMARLVGMMLADSTRRAITRALDL